MDENDPSTWPKPEFSGASAITVFFCIFIGAFSLGQIINNVTALVKVSISTSVNQQLHVTRKAVGTHSSRNRAESQLH